MTPHETGFLDRTIEVGAHTYRYVVYVPRDFDPAQSWPVVLFLHGAGERGVDGLKASQVGLGNAIRSNPLPARALVVFPQVPEDDRWLGEPADAAMMALERTVVEYRGDRSRLYLTGLSMGGYGTWHLALAHPRMFAAIAVVCGGLLPHDSAHSVRQSPLNSSASDPYRFTAHALRHLPIRIVHGAIDPIIPVDESRRMNAALIAEGADVRYIEYPDVGHNAWERAYADPEFWPWLLGHHQQPAR